MSNDLSPCQRTDANDNLTDLAALLVKYGSDFEYPYQYMDKNKSPASQQVEARLKLLHDTLEALEALLLEGAPEESKEAWERHVRGVLYGPDAGNVSNFN